MVVAVVVLPALNRSWTLVLPVAVPQQGLMNGVLSLFLEQPLTTHHYHHPPRHQNTTTDLVTLIG